METLQTRIDELIADTKKYRDRLDSWTKLLSLVSRYEKASTDDQRGHLQDLFIAELRRIESWTHPPHSRLSEGYDLKSKDGIHSIILDIAKTLRGSRVLVSQ